MISQDFDGRSCLHTEGPFTCAICVAKLQVKIRELTEENVSYHNRVNELAVVIGDYEIKLEPLRNSLPRFEDLSKDSFVKITLTVRQALDILSAGGTMNNAST